MPVAISNVGLVTDCIECIARTTDVPFHLIIIVDGGMKTDFTALQTFLAAQELDWRLLHNSKPVGLNRTISEGLQECSRKLTAVVGAEVRIDDLKWFGKVKQVFDRSQECGIVDTEPNTKSATMAPVKRRTWNVPAPGCRLAVLQTNFAQRTPPIGDIDPMEHWSRSAMLGGGSSWCASGVRYHLVESKEHQLWKEPSAPKSTTVLGSQSPKTPA